MAKSSQNVALVLSSGGARGIAQIAAIDQLVARGYNITSLAGSSIGSLIGGLYANGTLEDYKNWIAGLDYWDVFNLLDFSLSSKGFIKGEKVFKKIAPYIANKNIEDLSIPFVAVASDVINKKPVIYRSGSLKDAVRASVSIPTVLHPIETEDGLLVDGGVVNPIPVDLVERNENDILVVVDVNAHVPADKVILSKKQQTKLDELTKRFFNWNKQESNKKSNLGVFDMMNESFDLTQEMLTASLLQQYKPEIYIKISRKASGAMEFHRFAELMEIGKNASILAIDQYERSISEDN